MICRGSRDRDNVTRFESGLLDMQHAEVIDIGARVERYSRTGSVASQLIGSRVRFNIDTGIIGRDGAGKHKLGLQFAAGGNRTGCFWIGG